MKLLLLLIVVVLAGCGESQLDRRARVEGPGKEAASEEVNANEEAVATPKEAPKAPQAKGRPGAAKDRRALLNKDDDPEVALADGILMPILV